MVRAAVGGTIPLRDDCDVVRGDMGGARGFEYGCGRWSVAEAWRQLAGQRLKLKCEVLAGSNSMEGVGLLGARQIAYSLKPDLALVVDVTHATDFPTVSKIAHGDIRIGEGPAVVHGGSSHPEVVRRLEKVAKAWKIPLQHEAPSVSGGTRTAPICWTPSGVPCQLHRGAAR